MAVYVKPNGLLGNAYMAAIRPFRHLIVYPAVFRQIERDWRAPAIQHRPAGQHSLLAASRCRNSQKQCLRR